MICSTCNRNIGYDPEVVSKHLDGACWYGPELGLYKEVISKEGLIKLQHEANVALKARIRQIANATEPPEDSH